MIKQKCMILLLLVGFIVGSHRGYIALWRTDRTSPIMVFPYPVSSLPLCDQQALNRGIRIEDGTELAQLLEDFLS